MKDPKTFAFIKRKDKGMEKFQFPPLEEIFHRLESEQIEKIELKNNFINGWGKNIQNISNQLGSLIQEITFENGETFERTIQCRLDDSKHDGTPPHINVDVSTKSKIIKKDKISHEEKNKLHYSLLDLDKFEHTWIGIIYSGRQMIQPILFPHNEKAIEYWKKQEELLTKRNSISEEEMKKLSDEIMTLYREMNKNLSSAKPNYLSEGLGTPLLMKSLGERSEPFILGYVKFEKFHFGFRWSDKWRIKNHYVFLDA